MIKLEGTLLNVFTQQGGQNKKTGDQFEDRDKVQILGAMDPVSYTHLTLPTSDLV